MLVLLKNMPLEEFQYGASKIQRLEQLNKYELDDGFFGGNAKYIAVLSQEPLLLVVNHEFKTLAVAVLDSEIKKLPRKYINCIPKQYKTDKEPLIRQEKTV